MWCLEEWSYRVKISATLASVGTPSLVSQQVASHGDLGMISKKDILILISNSVKL